MPARASCERPDQLRSSVREKTADTAEAQSDAEGRRETLAVQTHVGCVRAAGGMGGPPMLES
jgi:hypothetical protein